MGEYRIATVAGRQVCGIMGHPDGIEMPAVWTVFVTVDDLDSTLGAIGQHGGAVVQPPIEIPGGARVAVATDPAGAMFALVAGGPRPDAPYLTDAPGTVGWVEILTRDPLAAVPFYEGIFGWQTLSDEASGYTIFTLDGAATCGLLPMPAEVPAAAPSHWATYFAVSDCDRIAERCAALGGRILRPPTTITTERFAVLGDGHVGEGRHDARQACDPCR